MECVMCKVQTDDTICPQCEAAAERHYDDEVTSRITGQDGVFVGLVKAYMDLEKIKPHTAAFIKYCARKVMQDHYVDVMPICNVEDYLDMFNGNDFDDDGNFVYPQATMLNIRFLNPRTGRYYFEQVTVLNLRDEDYESLNLEKIAL